ncbi:MAG TPA: hypothetical protein VFE25_00095 [Opitutaceae bacterium]|nr:hypothetical protein [Opitutaceae bacterium]
MDVASAEAVGVGVNGLDVTRCRITGDRIDLTHTSPFTWNRPPVFTFHKCDAKHTYLIVANGRAARPSRRASSWPSLRHPV